MDIGKWVKLTRSNLDILGHNQFEYDEFNEVGHFVSKSEQHAETADFRSQLAP